MTFSLVTKSSSSSFFLNTHQMSITVLSFVLGISFSVICLSIRLISSCFAITHSGSIRASSNFLGSSLDRNRRIKHSFSVALIVTHPSGSSRTKSQGWSLLHTLRLGRFILEISSDFVSRCWLWLLDPSFAPPVASFLRRVFIIIINNFRLNKSSSECEASNLSNLAIEMILEIQLHHHL